MFVWEALNKALDIEMSKDSKIFILGEEVGKNGGVHKITSGLQKKYGESRVLDTPISEIGFTGFAVGASFMKLKPVVEFMNWSFALQAIDHIINSAAKTCYMSNGRIHCPIVFRGPNGFNPGYAAQHTQDFSAVYGAVPGLKVIAPYTAEDHFGLLKSAIKDQNPVVFLENETLYNDTYDESVNFSPDFYQPFKSAIILCGDHTTLIGVSISVKTCLEIALHFLEEFGVEMEVVNLISIQPIDYETIFKSVRKTKNVVIVDFNWPCFGIASEISSVLYEEFFTMLRLPILKLTGEHVPTPYSSNLEELCFPGLQRAVPKIVEHFKKYDLEFEW